MVKQVFAAELPFFFVKHEVFLSPTKPTGSFFFLNIQRHYGNIKFKLFSGFFFIIFVCLVTTLWCEVVWCYNWCWSLTYTSAMHFFFFFLRLHSFFTLYAVIYSCVHLQFVGSKCKSFREKPGGRPSGEVRHAIWPFSAPGCPKLWKRREEKLRRL